MGFHDKRESIGVSRWQKDWRALFYNILIIFLGAKRFTIINVIHFLKKTLYSCIFGSKPDILTKFRVWTVSRFIVFLDGTSTTAWEKGFSKVSYEC